MAVPDVFFLPLLAPDLVDLVDGLVVGLPVVLEDVGVGDPVDGLVVGLPVVDSDLVVVFDEVCPVGRGPDVFFLPLLAPDLVDPVGRASDPVGRGPDVFYRSR